MRFVSLFVERERRGRRDFLVIGFFIDCNFIGIYG